MSHILSKMISIVTEHNTRYSRLVLVLFYRFTHAFVYMTQKINCYTFYVNCVFWSQQGTYFASCNILVGLLVQLHSLLDIYLLLLNIV